MVRGLRGAGSLFAAFFGALTLLVVLAGPAAAAARVTELRVSAVAIPPDGEATVTFRLAEPGPVAFRVVRLGPDRTVAAFVVRGRAGRNRFLFPGRIDRSLLPPGRYRLVTRTAGGSVVDAGFAVSPEAEDRARTDRPLPLRALLIAFLVVAIPLLAAASLPLRLAPGARSAELLATRRPVVALAGGVALVAALAVYAASWL